MTGSLISLQCLTNACEKKKPEIQYLYQISLDTLIVSGGSLINQIKQDFSAVTATVNNPDDQNFKALMTR